MLRDMEKTIGDLIDKQKTACIASVSREGYPDRVTAPDYYVLRFTAHSGRYYASFKPETFSILEETD